MAGKFTEAKGILESGKGVLGWKPKPGLIRLSEERKNLFKALGRIPGNTPLKEVGGLPNGNRLFVKFECDNRPTGSHYDRVYPCLLEAIERVGVNPASFILAETSSGNATPAFGYFARKLGYETIAFLPAELSEARRKLSEAQCDKVVLADEDEHGWGVFGAANAMKEALQANREERKRNPSAKRLYCVNHSQVVESLDAIKSLSIEAAKQFGKNQLDYFIGIAGNGTILYGAGKALKELFPKVKIIGAESEERPVLFLEKFPGKYETLFGCPPASVESMKGKGFFAPGTGALGVYFPHLHSAASLVDDVVLVGRNDAEAALLELHSIGFLVGHTSAISYSAAKRLSEKTKGKNILIIFYDKIERY